MKFIVFILAVVAVMQEVIIYRLNCKVDILIDFFNEVVHKDFIGFPFYGIFS